MTNARTGRTRRGRKVVDVQSRLDAIYDSIPDVNCKGLCARLACASLPMTPLEQLRIAARHGINLPLVKAPTGPDDLCRALTPKHLCSIYADRPLACRLYGAARGLPCPFGCEPAGGPITDGAARKAIDAVNELAGVREQPDR